MVLKGKKDHFVAPCRHLFGRWPEAGDIMRCINFNNVVQVSLPHYQLRQIFHKRRSFPPRPCIVAKLTTWSSARPKKLACMQVRGEKEEKEGEAKERERGRVEGRETNEGHP